MSKKKSIVLLGILIGVLILCVGCKKDNESANTTVIEPQTDENFLEEEEKVIYPEVEPPSDQTIRLRTDRTEEYRDVTLKKGDVVDIPHLTGYTFKGYQNDKDGNGVTYIDADGKYVLEYTGTELLVLWPIYEANEYRIIICEDNQPIPEFSKLICKYDENICDDLPWGKVIKKERKIDDAETCVIVGFENQDYQLTYAQNNKKIILNKLGDYVDHDEKTLLLNVVTTDLSYIWQCLNNRQISNAGILKQEVGTEKKSYDYFTIMDDIDLALLSQLGYKNVELKLTISKGAGNGIARVVITSDRVDKEKDLTNKELDILLVDTEKIKSDQFEITYSIPIDKLSGEFYVYYNSENILKETWDCAAITVDLVFKKF